MLMEECNYKPAELTCVQEILQSVVKVFRYFQSKHTKKNGILKKIYLQSTLCEMMLYIDTVLYNDCFL